MTIRVSTPGGATIDFPEGTDAETIQRVMAEATGTQKPQMGTVEAGLRGVAQGLTFGFADEIGGAAKGALSAVQGGGFSDAYEKGRDEIRAANKRAADEAPFAYYGGQVAGGVAVPFGAARAGAAAVRAAPGFTAPVAAGARSLGFGQLAANANAGLGARSIAGLREGAAYGALAGFGEGEGGFSERALNSGQGALVGGAIGAAAPGLVDAGAAVLRGVTTPVRAVMQPQAVGREKMAEALARDMGGEVSAGSGPTNYHSTFDRLTNRLDAGAQAGKNLMLADVGGENTRNLLRAAANQQSTGAERLRKTLDTRQGSQWARIERDLADTMGDGRSFYESVDNLVASRKAAAKPAFDRAYNQPWNVKADDDLAKFLTDRSYMRRVVEKTMENVEGMTGNNPASMKPWEFLHRVKFQIDREIASLKKGQADSKANWDLGDLVALKREYLGHIDRHNKAFGAALTKYGDDSSLISAAEDGFESALKTPVEEIRKTISGLKSTAEKEMFRVGAARAIMDRIRQGNVTRDRTENLFSSPDMQMRLRAIMPDQQSYREFQRSLVLEAKMADTRKAVQGNSTTPKQLAQADEAGQPMRMAVGAAQAATGRLEPALNLLGRTAQRFSGITPSTANAIIGAAMERDPVRVQNALSAAMRRAGNEPAARAQLAQELLSGGTSASE